MINCDVLIKNCTIFDQTLHPLDNRCVAIKDGYILDMDASLNAYAANEVIDGSGKLLMPGFVDGHTHVCQQMLRGRTTDEYPMIWTRILVPFESNLTEEDVRVSADLACLEMIKAGITSFADSGGVHMHEVAQVVSTSGMRAAIARSVMDIGSGIPASMKESVADHMRHNDELYSAWHGKADGRIEIFFGLRQVMTCSPELVRETAAQAAEKNTGIHAHLCEHKDEVSFCLKNYQRRPAEFLDDCGALGPNLLTAHNVTLSESDITLLAKRDVKLIHCPQANLGSHGVPKTPRILEVGCSVGIGNDGASAVALDHFEQLRILRSAVVAFWGLPVFDPVVLPTQALLKMGSEGGALALGKGDSVGKLTAGYKADVILVNLNQPHFWPTQNLAHTLVSCGSGRDVTDVIIDGKIVMRDRNVLTMDEERIMATSKPQMESIIRRAGI